VALLGGAEVLELAGELVVLVEDSTVTVVDWDSI